MWRNYSSLDRVSVETTVRRNSQFHAFGIGGQYLIVM